MSKMNLTPLADRVIIKPSEAEETTKGGIIRAIREGPYGRCVYECDNDVVDQRALKALDGADEICN